MKLQLAHVGLGPLGRTIVADAQRRGVGEIAAAVDCDAELAGKDLGLLVDGFPPGVTVRTSPMEVPDWSTIRCALVTTSSDLELCMDTFRDLLKRKVAVISTCEELSWPWLRHPILTAELHELCVRNRVSILGTGVNPGFLMDALPTIVSHACHGVRTIRVERVQDAAQRRLPFQKKVGAGLTMEEFEARKADGSLRHVGLGESLHFLAHQSGFRLDRWEETLEPVVAESETASGFGPIAAGRARGVRQVARGFQGDEPVVELVFHAAAGEKESFDRVRLDSDPPLDLTFRGGVHGDVATSAIVLNSIRPLLAAEPGLHTMASIPLTGCGLRD